MGLAQTIKRMPVVGPTLVMARQALNRATFRSSGDYWETRYLKGGNSGPGSYGRLAHFKADTINGIVREFGIQSVIELGCGDGNQLGLADYPRYHGFDISAAAVAQCHERFLGKAEFDFSLMKDLPGHTAELTMSLDVLYHLVEDQVFHDYMAALFDASTRFVLIYAPDTSNPRFNTHHVKVRKFSEWIAANRPKWKMVRHIPNAYPFEKDVPDTSFADFYLYERA